MGKRFINKVVLHCSATPEGRDIDAETIRKWHKKKGWSDIGYHYVIKLDGTIEEGRRLDKIGAHVKGHNSDSIGICYVGGVDKDMKPKDTRTDEQICSLLDLLIHLKEIYPSIKILGHSDFPNVSKACPSFDVKNFIENHDL